MKVRLVNQEHLIAKINANNSLFEAWILQKKLSINFLKWMVQHIGNSLPTFLKIKRARSSTLKSYTNIILPQM